MSLGMSVVSINTLKCLIMTKHKDVCLKVLSRGHTDNKPFKFLLVYCGVKLYPLTFPLCQDVSVRLTGCISNFL